MNRPTVHNDVAPNHAKFPHPLTLVRVLQTVHVVKSLLHMHGGSVDCLAFVLEDHEPETT